MSARPKPPAAKPPAESPDFKPPLRPHRALFVALVAVFAVWVAVLIALYAKTVYPLRHRPVPATTAR
jgi:hypothetical protein